MSKEITIYTIEECVVCGVVKKYLLDFGYKLNEIDCTTNPHREELRALGISGYVFPVVKQEGQKAWVGMNYTELSRLNFS